MALDGILPTPGKQNSWGRVCREGLQVKEASPKEVTWGQSPERDRLAALCSRGGQWHVERLGSVNAGEAWGGAAGERSLG